MTAAEVQELGAIVFPCCKRMVEWKDSRLPNFCPECGQQVYEQIRAAPFPAMRKANSLDQASGMMADAIRNGDLLPETIDATRLIHACVLAMGFAGSVNDFRKSNDGEEFGDAVMHFMRELSDLFPGGSDEMVLCIRVLSAHFNIVTNLELSGGENGMKVQ